MRLTELRLVYKDCFVGTLSQSLLPAAFVDKRRSGGGVTGQALVGAVRDRAVIMFDDLISTARRCSARPGAAAKPGQPGSSRRRRTASSWGRRLPSSPTAG